MKIRISLALAAVLALASAAPARAQTAADSAAIRSTAMDYVDGWYTGDGARMRRALHPELVKRIAQRDSAGAWRLQPITADALANYAGQGGGQRTPEAQRVRDVEILGIFGNAASVRVSMTDWVDFMHMARIDGRWQIVNVLWDRRPRS